MGDAATPYDDGGNVMTQLAACRGTVGIALFADPVVYELRGRGPDLDAAACALLGRDPELGGPVAAPWGWWVRESGQRALAVADVPTGSAAHVALAAVRHAAPDVAVADRSAGHAALVLVGPRAGRVAAAAMRLLPALLAEMTDGDDYRLVLVPAVGAPGLLRAVLAVGREDGAVAVRLPAVAALRAAHRVLAAQRPAPRLRLPDDPIHPGAPTP